MKKQFLLTILTICIITNCAIAAANPSDKYKKNIDLSAIEKANTAKTTVTTPLPQIGDPKLAEIDSIAKKMLKAAENRQDTRSYQIQLMKKGVSAMCPLQITAKRTPQCPPIKIEVNGRKMSGSKCAFTCYEYEGEKHEIGWCK